MNSFIIGIYQNSGGQRMKPNSPIILYIPASFIKGLNKYLKANKPGFKYDVLYFYYIIHYILVRQIKTKADFIPINKNLKAITVSNINQYIKILVNGEFIISDNHYIIGEKSKCYRINPNYLKGIDKIEIKTDCKLFNSIIKNQRRKKAHNNRLEPFLKRMYDELMKIDIDYQKAEKWILEQPNEVKRNSYMTALNLLADKRFRYFHRNSTNNRLDTNFTNLKSELKQSVIGDYVNIDLKNSQPFFLSMILEALINNKTHQGQNTLCCYLSYDYFIKTFGIKRIKEVSKIHQNQKKAFLVNLKTFKESVIRGTLYDDFIENYGAGITRKEVKDIMFKVLFSKNDLYYQFKKFIPYEKEKKVFATVYPFIYESIKILKSKDNVILPVFLQQVESYIFIDCIAKELVTADIIPITVHDSIMVKEEHKQHTIEIINRVFMENFGLIPTFDIKPINNKIITRI